MATHFCNNCGAPVLSRNRICHRCGKAVKNGRRLPVFWFVFTAAIFATYAYLDLMNLL